jgi:hypothetical protein
MTVTFEQRRAEVFRKMWKDATWYAFGDPDTGQVAVVASTGVGKRLNYCVFGDGDGSFSERSSVDPRITFERRVEAVIQNDRAERYANYVPLSRFGSLGVK